MESQDIHSMLWVLLLQEEMNNKMPALKNHRMFSGTLLFDLYFQASFVQASDVFASPWGCCGRWVSPWSPLQSLRGAWVQASTWLAEPLVGVKQWPQLYQFIAFEELLQNPWHHLGCAKFAGLAGCTIDCSPSKPTCRSYMLPQTQYSQNSNVLLYSITTL